MTYQQARTAIGAEEIECPVCGAEAIWLPNVPGHDMGGRVVCSSIDCHTDEEE